MSTEETTIPEAPAYSEEAVKTIIDAGVFYGRLKSRTNPRMKPFIFGNRGGVEIIDPVRVAEAADAAVAALKETARSGAMILFVATQPAAAEAIKIAEEFGHPFVARRWLGGTLTNYSTIFKRIEHFKQLKSDKVSGALGKYTKKERLNIDRDIARYEELLGGIEHLNKLPDLLLVVDPVMHHTAVREARRMKIPVAAFLNTDGDPRAVAYPVPGNTSARLSINWFLGNVRQALEDARAEGPLVKDQGSVAGENAAQSTTDGGERQ